MTLQHAVMDHDIVVVDGRPVLPSYTLAERLGVEHLEVMGRIEPIFQAADEEVSPLVKQWLLPSHYTDVMESKTRDCYLMTREGFVLVIMHFDGTKALRFKAMYIERFRTMEEDVQRPQYMTDREWLAYQTITKELNRLHNLLPESLPAIEALTRFQVGMLRQGAQPYVKRTPFRLLKGNKKKKRTRGSGWVKAYKGEWVPAGVEAARRGIPLSTMSVAKAWRREMLNKAPYEQWHRVEEVDGSKVLVYPREWLEHLKDEIFAPGVTSKKSRLMPYRRTPHPGKEHSLATVQVEC